MYLYVEVLEPKTKTNENIQLEITFQGLTKMTILFDNDQFRDILIFPLHDSDSHFLNLKLFNTKKNIIIEGIDLSDLGDILEVPFDFFKIKFAKVHILTDAQVNNIQREATLTTYANVTDAINKARISASINS